MKKISLEKTKEISAGASFSGNTYTVAGVKFNCAHACSYKRGHNVTGNSSSGYTVTHTCVNAP